MKILNRLVLVIITLFFMFVSLLLTIYSFGLVNSSSLPVLMEGFYQRYEAGLLFFLAFLLGAWVIYPFFTQKIKKKINVINNTELGEVDVTLDALENLVQGVAIQQEEIEEIKTKLEPTEEGIKIHLTGKVYQSTMIPELTKNLQKVIKSYIEDTTGVRVEEVKILIDNIYKKDKKNRRKSKKVVKKEKGEE